MVWSHCRLIISSVKVSSAIGNRDSYLFSTRSMIATAKQHLLRVKFLPLSGLADHVERVIGFKKFSFPFKNIYFNRVYLHCIYWGRRTKWFSFHLKSWNWGNLQTRNQLDFFLVQLDTPSFKSSRQRTLLLISYFHLLIEFETYPEMKPKKRW